MGFMYLTFEGILGDWKGLGFRTEGLGLRVWGSGFWGLFPRIEKERNWNMQITDGIVPDSLYASGYKVPLRWTPHPVIVTIGDNRDDIKASYIPTIPLLQGGGSS